MSAYLLPKQVKYYYGGLLVATYILEHYSLRQRGASSFLRLSS